ncbi:calcium-binding protein [Pelagibius sp.]|uniref:calcium-binding protein n=1 Tax=Pelagibius sp. TaxID=1931238 RepID=UPI003BAF4A3E
MPPVNPVGPGADQALFSRFADNVDLNAIDVGGYQDGTQYDAGRGNDSVVLPGNAREALEAGFAEGTLFDAGRGNDLVTGGSLADLVDGDRGHDTLLGGAGDDTLLGGNNNDSLVGGADDDLLDGGRNNDILIGGAGDDTLLGGHGRDTLEGDDGRDLLSGGGGRDTLEGGDGQDTLLGGNGRDTLEGGLGNDVMEGGNGRDVFSFSLAENQGDDLILDFNTGNGGDRLELTDLLDVNGDNDTNIADLDAGGHTVSGTADSIVITFEQGGSLTLDGLDGSSVDSFQDLLDIKVNIDIS